MYMHIYTVKNKGLCMMSLLATPVFVHVLYTYSYIKNSLCIVVAYYLLYSYVRVYVYIYIGIKRGYMQSVDGK